MLIKKRTVHACSISKHKIKDVGNYAEYQNEKSEPSEGPEAGRNKGETTTRKAC